MTFLRRNYKILFLLFVVFGTYYPSIFAGFNLVDDFEVFGRLEDTRHIDLIGQFLTAGNGYYRPLTNLTFYFDKIIWGLNPSFMHLENIILHALNALLVFLLAENIFVRPEMRKLELPLLSALIFAIHPINTEAVNWISGRFDLLATAFVLGAAFFIQRGLEKKQFKYFAFSALTLLLGCFAKETALFFFPAAIFLVLSSSGNKTLPKEQSGSSSQRLRAIITFSAVFAFYILFRLISSITTANPGLGQAAGRAAQGFSSNMLQSAAISIKAFGFYVKKLFAPLPLNFAIINVSDIYFWVGVAFIIIVVVSLFRRNPVTDYLIVSLSLISSCIVVLFARAAWTPVAERYLYMSSTFFAISITGLVFMMLKRYYKEALITAIALPVLLCAAFVTVKRNIVWQDNLSLYEDTLRKSPGFIKLQNSLAQALKEKGRLAEADVVLRRAIIENPGQINLYINRADLFLRQGDTDGARSILGQAFKEKKFADPEVLKMLAYIDETKLMTARGKQERNRISNDLIETYDILFMKTKDALFPYRSGQLMLVMGKKQIAGDYFFTAYNAAPEGNRLRDPARKLAEKLKRTVK